MKLFKQLMADINEARTQEESQFPEAELEARKMGLLPENDMGLPDPKEEMVRIAAFWRGQAHKLTDAELSAHIANDLEQIEYPPEVIDNLVPKIVKLVRK